MKKYIGKSVEAALNDACSKAEEFKASKMGKFGGMM